MASAITVIVDISTVVILTSFSFVIRHLAVPYQRGFNKDDESLMYPFKPSTISAATLYAVGLSLPSIIVMLIEGYRVFRQRRRSNLSSSAVCERSALQSWLLHCYNYLIYFYFGVALTNLATNIPKYVIGRLRPHFFDVCVPDWQRLNSSGGYITENICTGSNLHLIQEARLSFPSGHASISMYCMVYAILYLDEQWPWNLPELVKPTLQFVFFLAAFFTGLSRVSDYKHHWSDVLAGALLGGVLAWLIMVKVGRKMRNKETYQSDSSKADGCKLESVVSTVDGGVSSTGL